MTKIQRDFCHRLKIWEKRHQK